MPGVPTIPIVLAIVSLMIAANQILTDPIDSAIGLMMVLVGLPVYWLWGRRATTRAAAPRAAIGEN